LRLRLNFAAEDKRLAQEAVAFGLTAALRPYVATAFIFLPQLTALDPAY
jgi:hypothetical protein